MCTLVKSIILTIIPLLNISKIKFCAADDYRLWQTFVDTFYLNLLLLSSKISMTPQRGNHNTTVWHNLPPTHLFQPYFQFHLYIIHPNHQHTFPFAFPFFWGDFSYSSQFSFSWNLYMLQGPPQVWSLYRNLFFLRQKCILCFAIHSTPELHLFLLLCLSHTALFYVMYMGKYIK